VSGDEGENAGAGEENWSSYLTYYSKQSNRVIENSGKCVMLL